MAHFAALLELVRGPNEDKGRVCTAESVSVGWGGGRGANSLLMEKTPWSLTNHMLGNMVGLKGMLAQAAHLHKAVTRMLISPYVSERKKTTR